MVTFFTQTNCRHKCCKMRTGVTFYLGSTRCPLTLILLTLMTMFPSRLPLSKTRCSVTMTTWPFSSCLLVFSSPCNTELKVSLGTQGQPAARCFSVILFIVTLQRFTFVFYSQSFVTQVSVDDRYLSSLCRRQVLFSLPFYHEHNHKS